MSPYLQDEAHQTAVKIWEEQSIAEALRNSKSKSKNKKKNKKKKKNPANADMWGPKHPGLINKVTRAWTLRLSRAGSRTHTHTHTHTRTHTRAHAHLPFPTC